MLKTSINRLVGISIQAARKDRQSELPIIIQNSQVMLAWLPVVFSTFLQQKVGVRTAKNCQLLIDHFLPAAKSINSDFRLYEDLSKQSNKGSVSKLFRK